MKIMVTGAFGNIGRSTVNALLDHGHEVICFDLKTEAAEAQSQKLPHKAQAVWGDITNSASVAEALSASAAEAVVHLAAIIPPASEIDTELSYKVNVSGTENLVSAMLSSEHCKRLVFASSTAVHGSDFERQSVLTVDLPFSPEDEYAKHKVEGEKFLQASDLDWTILRVAATPPMNISSAQKGSLRMLFDVPSNGRVEFLHVKDAGLAFANAVSCDAAIRQTMFIGGGKANGCQLTGYEFVSMMTRAAGLGVLPRKAFSSNAELIHADWVDSCDSQALLNYQRYTPEDMVQQMRQQAGLRYYLIRLLSPLARYFVLKKSPYYRNSGV